LNSTVKTALLWVVIIVLVFLLWSLFNTAKGQSEKIPWSMFVDRVNQGYVEKVNISGDEIRGETKATAPGAERDVPEDQPARDHGFVIDAGRASIHPRPLRNKSRFRVFVILGDLVDYRVCG